MQEALNEAQNRAKTIKTRNSGIVSRSVVILKWTTKLDYKYGAICKFQLMSSITGELRWSFNYKPNCIKNCEQKKPPFRY